MSISLLAKRTAIWFEKLHFSLKYFVNSKSKYVLRLKCSFSNQIAVRFY